MKTNIIIIGLNMIFIGVGLLLGGIVGAIIANPGPLPEYTFENIFIYYIMFLIGIILLIGGIILLSIGIIKKYKKNTLSTIIIVSITESTLPIS